MYKSGKTFGIATYQPVSLLTPFQNFFILRAAYRGKPRGLNPPPAFYVTNRYWLLLIVMIFSMYFMMSTFFGSAAYYAQYILGSTDYYTPVSNALSLAQILTLFATPFVMKKVGKRNTALLGAVISGAGFLINGFVGDSVAAVTALSAVKGIGFGMMGGTMFGMLQDAITYGEWQVGFNHAGMGNAASSFCMKIGSGIGTAALGWILGAGGFDAQMSVQSAAGANAIRVAFVWVPVITSVISIVVLLFFDLDKKYAAIAKDLAEGRHKNDA